MSFVRYLLVQVLAYGLDMGGFLLMLELVGTGPLLANIAGKVLAGTFAYFAHHYFTFAISSGRQERGQALKYLSLLAFNLPLSSLVLAATLYLVPHAVLAKLFADAACIGLTYWLSKTFVFVQRRTLPDASQPPGGS